MVLQAQIILTTAEVATAKGFNTPDVAIDPRAVSGANPGTGLAGKFVAPRAIVSDPDYLARAPGMVAFLLTLPFADLDTDLIFAPPTRG